MRPGSARNRGSNDERKEKKVEEQGAEGRQARHCVNNGVHATRTRQIASWERDSERVHGREAAGRPRVRGVKFKIEG